MKTMQNDLPLHLRLAGREHAPALRRLAELDSTSPLRGEILVALREGEPVAALSLDDGRAAADPFRPSADAIAVLRLWAQQVSGAREQAPSWWRRPRRRLRIA
jgi:hypothetical protein